MSQPFMTVNGRTYSVEQVESRMKWFSQLARDVIECNAVTVHIKHLQRDVRDFELIEGDQHG